MSRSSESEKRIPNRRRPLPLFQQVKDYVVENIESGRWPPHHRLASEHQLVKKLQVSRMTVHRALRELTSEGFLKRVQGVGTFVATRRPQSALLEIRSIADDIASRGGQHSADVHLLREERATRVLSEAFHIPLHSPVFHSLIVHRDNGRPVQLADRFVNPAMAPDYLAQDFSKTTPSEYLFEMGPLTEAEHMVEAIMPDRETRQLLEIGPREPCLLVNRRTWSHHLVATTARLFHPGSGFRLVGRFRPPSLNEPLVA